MPYKPREIHDADGDGVEDNTHLTPDEIDSFYIPGVFNNAGDDIYNTHHGNTPGERQKANEPVPPPENPTWPEEMLKGISDSEHVNSITDRGVGPIPPPAE